MPTTADLEARTIWKREQAGSGITFIPATVTASPTQPGHAG